MTFRAMGGVFWQCRKRSPVEAPVDATTPMITGSGFDPVIDENRGEDIAVERIPEEFWYRFNRHAPPPTATVSGSAGAASPPEASFVYLDVGAWFGSTASQSDTQSRWHKARRDFGVICGPHVLLCSFSSATEQFTEDAGWVRARSGTGPAIQSIVALFQRLSGTHNNLGDVKVRRYVVAAATNPLWVGSGHTNEASWTIHVIVGDTHIPMMDRLSHTMAGGPLPESHPTLQRFLHSVTDGIVATNDYGHVPRVRRYGRLDLGPIELLVTNLVGATQANGLTAILTKYQQINDAYNRLSDTERLRVQILAGTAGIEAVLAALASIPEILAAMGIGLAVYNRINDVAGVGSDTMPVTQAVDWYSYYRNGVGGATVPPADIFERAGQHLLDFVTALHDYAANRGANCNAQFHQLGDMFDFWVGFTCHYLPGSTTGPVQADGGGQDDPPDAHRGREMVTYWLQNCLSNTVQGQQVSAALDLASTMNPAPSYLYGNHDNYLGSVVPSYTVNGTPSYHPTDLVPQRPDWMANPAYAGEAGPPYRVHGQARTLDRRAIKFEGDGLYMEHGHQWDSSNEDGAAIKWWGRYLIGSPSPQGELLTQAAFIRPQPIRGFEGTASSAVEDVPDTRHPYGQRLLQIAYAADRWVNGEGNFYCYVMGHTHCPSLSTVHVQTQARDRLAEQFRTDHLGDPAVTVSLSLGTDYDGRARVSGFSSGDDSIIWTHLLPDPQHSWVALDDPDQTTNARRRGLWKYVTAATGSVQFHGVPPGAYMAKAYLDSEDASMFRPGTERLYVEGISIEGPAQTDRNDSGAPDTTNSFRIHGSATSPQTDRPIVLRWAFTAAAMANRCYMILCNGGELPDSLAGHEIDRYEAIERLRHNGRPTKAISELMGSHPDYGRVPMPRDFLQWVYRRVAAGVTSFEIHVCDDIANSGPPHPFYSLDVGHVAFTVRRG